MRKGAKEALYGTCPVVSLRKGNHEGGVGWNEGRKVGVAGSRANVYHLYKLPFSKRLGHQTAAYYPSAVLSRYNNALITSAVDDYMYEPSGGAELTRAE